MSDAAEGDKAGVCLSRTLGGQRTKTVGCFLQYIYIYINKRARAGRVGQASEALRPQLCWRNVLGVGVFYKPVSAGSAKMVRNENFLLGVMKTVGQWPKMGVPGAFLAKNGCT